MIEFATRAPANNCRSLPTVSSNPGSLSISGFLSSCAFFNPSTSGLTLPIIEPIRFPMAPNKRMKGLAIEVKVLPIALSIGTALNIKSPIPPINPAKTAKNKPPNPLFFFF